MHEQGVYYKFYERKTHVEVAEFLIFLKNLNIIDCTFILDCWSAHTTNKLVEKLKGHAITIVFLPTNASWLNDVERVFADVEKNALANSDEPDSEHLQNRIANYLRTEYPKKI